MREKDEKKLQRSQNLFPFKTVHTWFPQGSLNGIARWHACNQNVQEFRL